MEAPVSPLSPQELEDLGHAKSLLEYPGLTIRLANLVGSPVEKAFQLLPRDWSRAVEAATQAALLKALEIGVATLGTTGRRRSAEGFHKLLAAASGAIGGAFGLAALAVELPISTTIMLRSIADIARSEGMDAGTIETKLHCLEVFALGGRTAGDDAADSGYWAVRAALAKTISDAAAFLAEKGVLERTAPAIVRLIAAISSRFGVLVSEQVAAKAVPLIGAASGSIINVLFIDHFQDMARGHFIVKRLEARHGLPAVRDAYERFTVRA